MIFSPIDQERTSREVEKQIEKLILEGVLRVGDKLPGERELSTSVNVSRPIVREALANLEKRKLIIAKHGGGTYVADVIGTVFAPPIVELIATNNKAKQDYMEYRREIEGKTAAMAAERATQSDKALLKRIMSDMADAHEARNPALEAEIDVEFHSAIGECAHNIILLHTLRSCYRLLADDVFFNRDLVYHNSDMRQQLFEQHHAIYDGVIAGDASAASQAAQAHIAFVEKATRDAEQHGDRSQISSLRLAQRENAGSGKTRKQS